MNLSSRGLSSRQRGSTLSGNWTMDFHSRLRKLGKSVLSLGSVANFSCSRNRTPTSPLSMTSQPGSAVVPSDDSSSLSSSSCSCFSVPNKRRHFDHISSLLLYNMKYDPAALTSQSCHHLQLFMEDSPELFIVHPSGMAPVAAKKQIGIIHSWYYLNPLKIPKPLKLKITH